MIATKPRLLGKLPKVQDTRNFRFSLMAMPDVAIPARFDQRTQFPGLAFPHRPYCNLDTPCCVIAGRGNHEALFDMAHEGRVPDITDDEILSEFKAEGGDSTGLPVLPSLKAWMAGGWIAAGELRKISCFVELDVTNEVEIKKALLAGMAVGLGLNMPKTADAQTDAGQPWDLVPDDSGQLTGDAAPGSWGGHYVALVGWDESGWLTESWGEDISATPRFVTACADESYGMTDNVEGLNGSAVNKGLLATVLTVLEAANSASEAIWHENLWQLISSVFAKKPEPLPAPPAAPSAASKAALLLVLLSLAFASSGCVYLGLSMGIPAPTVKGPATGIVGAKLEFRADPGSYDPLNVHNYRFDAGDGSAVGDWSGDGDMSWSHAYAAAGTFKVTAQEKCPLEVFITNWSKPATVTITNGTP